MAKLMRGLIEYIGLADELPTSPKYFTEISIPETLQIPCQKPPMEQILSVMVDPEVISMRLVETEKAISDEGQSLSGCKLVVELRMHEKVKYVADELTQPVHVAEYASEYKSVFIVIPCQVNDKDVCELIRRNRVKVNVYVEDIYAEMVGPKTLFKNVTALVDVVFRA